MKVTLKRNATVALYGDSLMSQCSQYIRFFLGLRKQNITTIDENYAGTAICDWLPVITSGDVRPTLAVFLFSGNFITPCTQNRHMDEEDVGQRWLDVCIEDMTAAMDACKRLSVPAAWVIPPNDVGTPAQSHPLTPYYSWISGTRGQQWINADSSPAGNVIENGVYVHTTSDGKAVRADDNHHFAPDGAMRFANAICTYI